MNNEKQDGASQERTYCVFKVSDREFLLPAEKVKEIVEVVRIFPIPGAPEYVYGAFPLRGSVTPAIDMSKIYPIEEPSYVNAKLLIVEVEKENIGFLSETTPYLVTFDVDIHIEDIINIEEFFEKYRIKK
ncbi:MAG: chemotaxis protein CheW [Dissulfurispiraceae bacterium]